MRLTHSEAVVVTDWLGPLVNYQVETPMTVVLNRNGYDRVFGCFAASLGLIDLLASVAIMPVAQ